MVEFDEKAFLAKIQAEKQEQESRRPNDPFRLLISLCVVGGIFYLIYLGVSASSRETQELQSIWKNGLRSQATVIYFREREVKVSGRNRFSKETKKLKDIFVELRLPNGTKVKAQLGRGKNEDYNRGDTLTVV